MTLAVAGLFMDALTAKDSVAIAQTSQVSRLPGAALSVPYYEARVRVYRDYSDRFYQAMEPINSMDFVYAR